VGSFVVPHPWDKFIAVILMIVGLYAWAGCMRPAMVLFTGYINNLVLSDYYDHIPPVLVVVALSSLVAGTLMNICFLEQQALVNISVKF